MDENKNEQQQTEEREQGVQQKSAPPKKGRAKQIVTFVCLGVAVACVVALLVLTYCFS